MSDEAGASPGQVQTPAQLHRAASIIGVALPGGVTIFAGVAWILTGGGERPLGDASLPAPIFYIWLAAAFAACAGAIAHWRARVDPLIRPTEGGPRAPEVLSRLIVTWALVEGPSLLGVVVFLLTGAVLPLVGSLVLVWGTAALTRPQRAWFGG